MDDSIRVMGRKHVYDTPPCLPLSLVPGEKYDGLQTELVVGFDIGTTFSGVSYAFLLPGEVPDIVSVTE